LNSYLLWSTFGKNQSETEHGLVADGHLQRIIRLVENITIYNEETLKNSLKNCENYALSTLQKECEEANSEEGRTKLRLKLAELLYSILLFCKDSTIKGRAEVILKYL